MPKIADQIQVQRLADCPITKITRSLLDSAHIQICINSRKCYLQKMSESQDKQAVDQLNFLVILALLNNRNCYCGHCNCSQFLWLFLCMSTVKNVIVTLKTELVWEQCGTEKTLKHHWGSSTADTVISMLPFTAEGELTRFPFKPLSLCWPTRSSRKVQCRTLVTSVSGRCVKEHSPAQEEDGSTDTSGVPECYSFCQSGLVALSTVQSTSNALVFSRLPSNYFIYTKGVLRKITRKINFCFIATFCIIFLTFNHTVSCLESLFGAETVFMIFLTVLCTPGVLHTKFTKVLLLT